MATEAITPTSAPKPTAPLKTKKKKLNKAIAGVCALLLMAYAVKAWKERAAASEEKPEIKTTLVERGDVKQTVSATGKLQAFTLIDVKSKAGGKVIQMAVEEGTRVKRGQLIAIIDRQDVSALYRQAEADANAAASSVAQSRANEAQQRASLGPQIRQAGESVSSAQARLAQAQESLKLQSETTGPAIRQAAESVTASKARLAQTQEALDLQRKTSETAVAEAQSGVDAAQARLEQAQTQATTQPELTQAQIAQAEAQINQSEAQVSSAQAGVTSAQENLKLLQSAAQPQATARAQAEVNSAKSDLTTGEANLRRLRGLLEKGFVAKSQVDTAENTVVSARARLQTAQAVLDTLKEQQASEVREAKARVEQAQGSLNQAKAGLANARTGLTTAKANTIQDTLRQKDVETARAALKQAQSGLQNAIANRRQVQVRQAEVNAARAAVRQAEASLTSAQANTRQIALKRADINAAAAAMRQAEASLANTRTQTITSQARAAEVAQAQARLERARVTQQNAATNLAETRVVAPRDGVVVTKYVDEGTIIQSGTSGFSGGTAIVQLAQVDRMYIDAQVDEADVALIEAGQKVDITLDAYPESPKMGTVRKVFPQATEEQNVTYIHVQVEIDPMDVDERLRPGMNGTCDFEVESAEDVVLVPSEAVKENEGVTEVTVIKDPKKPLDEKTNQVVRQVEVGVRGDESVQILSGLKEGETVITQIIEPITATPQTGGMGGGAPRGSTGGFGGGGGGRGR